MRLFLPILLAAALGLPPAAAAETVVADPDARQVTALGGTIVWVSGGEQAQRLMQRSHDGAVTPVAGSEGATFYRSPDLGRDADGDLVLSYAHCTTITRCRYVRSDLEGGRSRIRGLAPRRCRVSSTPAIWRSRTAYGLACFKRRNGQRIFDSDRSGLYVKTRSGQPRRLPTPRNARRSGSLTVDDTDVRSRRVAAVYSDVYAYAVVQSTRGRNRHSSRVATSEGDGEQDVAGVSVGTGDARMWSLTRSFHAGDPAQSIIHRSTEDCDDWQVVTAAGDPAAETDFPYVDLAVDRTALYAVDPGVGIVRHAYEPDVGC